MSMFNVICAGSLEQLKSKQLTLLPGQAVSVAWRTSLRDQAQGLGVMGETNPCTRRRFLVWTQVRSRQEKIAFLQSLR